MTNGILSCEAVAERGLVERYVAGRLRDDQDLGVLETHLLTCEACREEVRLGLAVRAELGAPGWHAPSQPAQPGRHRLRNGLLVGLATAATALLLVYHRPSGGPLEERDGGVHRGPEQGSVLAPVARQPTGRVASVARLRWSGVVQAHGYRVRVLDAAGTLLWEVQVADTTLALPDSLHLTIGQPYYWTVASQTGPGHWVESRLTEFVVLPGQR
jgi:hypothetical protein